MKVEKISIHSFRSVKDCTFILGDILAIVGQNNSGKSAILRALNCFFNFEQERLSVKNGLHQYSGNSLAKIQLTFDDIPIKVIYANKLLPKRKMVVQCTFKIDSKEPSYKFKKGNKWVDVEADFLMLLGKDIQFVYIPLSRDFRQAISTEQTLLKKVLDSYLSKHTHKRDTLTPKVKDAATYLNKNALAKISYEIESNYLHSRNFNVSIDHSNEIDFRILVEDLSIVINEQGKSFPLSECGSGVQSLINIALYRYLATLNNCNVIFGVEEPEVNLHPQSQKEFLIELKRGTPHNVQALITTHSTVIIDQLDHHSILLVRKVDDSTRSFRSEARQLPINFWSKNSLQPFNYATFYKFRNSEFFYSKLVIVVESKTDAEVYRKLLFDFGINLEDYGVSFLILDGTRNFQYAFSLLLELGIPRLFILDKDFFFEYSNGEKELSRNPSGYFKYQKTFKTGSIISKLINSSTDRTSLETLLHSNHSKANALMENYDLICLDYNMEMDLIATSVARNKYFTELGIALAKQNSKELLVNFKKKIKSPELLINVLNGIPHQNLPNTYKRIRNVIKKRATA
jgi:predicted ATP-dependent endonuclease of OLD family